MDLKERARHIHTLMGFGKMSPQDIEDNLQTVRNDALDEAAQHLYRRENDLKKCEGDTYLQRVECNVMARSIQGLKAMYAARI